MGRSGLQLGIRVSVPFRLRHQFLADKAFDQDGDEIPDGVAIEAVMDRANSAFDTFCGMGVGEGLDQAIGHPTHGCFLAHGIETQRYPLDVTLAVSR
ncbi:hypothetical protein AB0B45_46270 [Nonomuraea sp. NPDC049152]